MSRYDSSLAAASMACNSSVALATASAFITSRAFERVLMAYRPIPASWRGDPDPGAPVVGISVRQIDEVRSASRRHGPSELHFRIRRIGRPTALPEPTTNPNY